MMEGERTVMRIWVMEIGVAGQLEGDAKKACV